MRRKVNRRTGGDFSRSIYGFDSEGRGERERERGERREGRRRVSERERERERELLVQYGQPTYYQPATFFTAANEDRNVSLAVCSGTGANPRSA